MKKNEPKKVCTIFKGLLILGYFLGLDFYNFHLIILTKAAYLHIL